MNFRRELVALVLFGIAFGYVEAAVVVYLRAIDEPMRQRVRPERDPDDVFPLSRLEDYRFFGKEDMLKHMFCTELGREFATMVMLAAIGLAHARNVRQWFAGFMISFAVWDIFYYVFLKLLLNWPASLMTWDILFYLPVAWAGPVITPVIIAVEMTAAGVLILWREQAGRPLRVRLGHWATIVGGGLVVVVAFCWDYKNIMNNGLPNPFNWPLFLVGDAVGIAGFLHAVWTTPSASPEV